MPTPQNVQTQSTICRLELKGLIWRTSRNDFKLYNIWNKYIYRKDYLRGYWLKEGLSFYKFPREENLKQQWLIKIKCRKIQSIQHARMCHAYCFGLNPGWIWVLVLWPGKIYWAKCFYPYSPKIRLRKDKFSQQDLKKISRTLQLKLNKRTLLWNLCGETHLSNLWVINLKMKTWFKMASQNRDHSTQSSWTFWRYFM